MDRKLKKIIVTTTINPPTIAIQKFQQMPDWDLVVIGDKKTPPNYKLDRGIFVTPDMQESYDRELSDLIGWNCIQRRNFGLLWAWDQNADIVALVDDDNIPEKTWGTNLLLGRPVDVTEYQTPGLAFDPIGATNENHLWHRGFPMELVPERSYANFQKTNRTFDVQADFWNGDPDIDAVCRMIYRPECKFSPTPFPFTSTKPGPFNSQNTFITKDCLKDYFLFPHIGRMDDIWAAYYLQALGRKVVYGQASVYQDRNVHNLIKDMKNEYIGYENNLAILEKIKTDPDIIRTFLPENSWRAFEAYRRHFPE